MRSFGAVGCLVTLAACSGGAPDSAAGADPNAPINVQQINAQATARRKASGGKEVAANRVAALSGKDLLRVCKAGAGFRNGRDPNAINAKRSGEKQVRLSYRRDDGKLFRYDCLVSSNVLRFRMIDEAGPGTGPGAWSGKGSTTTFKLSADSIEVKVDFFDGSSDQDTIHI